MMGANDLLWVEVLLIESLTKEDTTKIYQRYISLLEDETIKRKFFYALDYL
jgi:hypothetical protein